MKETLSFFKPFSKTSWKNNCFSSFKTPNIIWRKRQYYKYYFWRKSLSFEFKIFADNNTLFKNVPPLNVLWLAPALISLTLIIEIWLFFRLPVSIAILAELHLSFGTHPLDASRFRSGKSKTSLATIETDQTTAERI